MGSLDDRTHGAEEYVKRWEPHEECDASSSVYDELARILWEDERRDALEWFDGQPVFSGKRENTVPQ